jgi:IMP cyclohydrolase
MYVGRIVAVGRNEAGKVAALYRVSSRSFPRREARRLGDAVVIRPSDGEPNDAANPYIAYTCLMLVGDRAVVSNGAHTDVVGQKLRSGMAIRDALVAALWAMDFEDDALSTPRIAGVVDRESSVGYLGIVTRDALHVRAFTLSPGDLFYVATYELTEPSEALKVTTFGARSAGEACTYLLGEDVFSQFERPVCSAAALDNSDGTWEIATAAPVRTVA